MGRLESGAALAAGRPREIAGEDVRAALVAVGLQGINPRWDGEIAQALAARREAGK